MSTNKEVDDPLSNILCEFFEVAVHNILYTRKLYPESIFARRKKYGTVVYRSMHPQLNIYITEILKAVLYHSKNGRLRRLFLCLKSSSKVMERYVFDILQLKQNSQDNHIYIQLEQNLRAFCLKLQTCNTYLEPLPKDSTFNIQLHTTEYSATEFNEDPAFSDFPWVQIGYNDELSSPEIMPLQEINTDVLKLDVYVECSNKVN